jgi:hypothetical protein
MPLTNQEAASLQSYADSVLGPIQARVKVSYNTATEQLGVHCKRLPDLANNVDARKYGCLPWGRVSLALGGRYP